MNFLRRGLRLFQDSPTYGRDSATLWSGFTVGTTALLLNGILFVAIFAFLNLTSARDFRVLLEGLGFGQVLALMTLGCATWLVTLFVPLRLMTIFWGPRIGRYFDQIVLSGIAPIRFIIGKAMSQNLFLGLALLLLVPYFILSLTFGGVNLLYFALAVVLLWIYSMAIALVTLWLAMYFNELIATATVIFIAVCLICLGCSPDAARYVPLSPTPFIVQPAYESFSSSPTPMSPIATFLTCAIGLSTICACSVVAIYLGLYTV